MTINDLWIDLKTIVEIKEVTPRGLRIALNKGKYTFRETKTQGGKSYEILLSSLEPHVQEVYKNTYYREIIETVNHDTLLPVEKPVKTETGFIPEQASLFFKKENSVKKYYKMLNRFLCLIFNNYNVFIKTQPFSVKSASIFSLYVFYIFVK